MSSGEVKRINYSTRSPWEPLRGYSRAVLAGNVLYISGTTAMAEDGQVVGGQSAYQQTKYVIGLIKQILHQAGFAIKDVVRTRLFVTDMSKWDEYAAAHREAFEKYRPASSLVQVSKLVDPRLMLEMEIEAVKGCDIESSVIINYQSLEKV